MPQVEINGVQVETEFEITPEEAEQGICLALTPVRIDMAGETYHTRGVAKYQGEFCPNNDELVCPRGQRTFLDIDVPSVARNLRADLTEKPFAISILVELSCGDQVFEVPGEKFAIMMGYKLPEKSTQTPDISAAPAS